MADMHVLQAMKANIEKMAADVQKQQQEMVNAVQGLQGLRSQLTENTLVMEELTGLEDGAKIFKLVGPVLITQDSDDAKSTVQTRIDFITNELKTATSKVERLEKDQQSKRTALLTEQHKFQTLVQQVTARQ